MSMSAAQARRQAVAQALEEETDLSVTDVVWQDTEEGAEVTVSLEWKGQPLTVTAAG